MEAIWFSRLGFLTFLSMISAVKLMLKLSLDLYLGSKSGMSLFSCVNTLTKKEFIKSAFVLSSTVSLPFSGQQVYFSFSFWTCNTSKMPYGSVSRILPSCTQSPYTDFLSSWLTRCFFHLLLTHSPICYLFLYISSVQATSFYVWL